MDTQVRLSSDNWGRGWSNASTRNTKDCQKPLEAKKQAGIDSPWIPRKWNQPCQQLGFRLSDSKTVKEHIPVVSSHPVCGTLNGTPGKPTQGSPYGPPREVLGSCFGPRHIVSGSWYTFSKWMNTSNASVLHLTLNDKNLQIAFQIVRVYDGTLWNR